MGSVVTLSIVFDPRELWFCAGFNFSIMGIAQWSQDPDSAARALERFLNDDNDFTEVHIPARKAILESSKVVVKLSAKALSSLQSSSRQKQISVEEWLGEMLGSPNVEIETYS